MYVRSTGEGRERVRIPENYSGHAFRDQNPYGDMPPPTRIPQTTSAIKDTLERTDVYDGQNLNESPLAREELMTNEHTDGDDSESASISSFDNGETAEASRQKEESAFDGKQQKSPSIFSSLLPQVSSSRFPFGHGIGNEELLILALMLIIYTSEEADEELLLLLGFLLFAG